MENDKLDQEVAQLEAPLDKTENAYENGGDCAKNVTTDSTPEIIDVDDCLRLIVSQLSG